MENAPTHEIELFPFESFKTLLTLEINRTRRYKTPLSLIQFAIETNPDTPDIRYSAEMLTISVLDAQLRDTDIPCLHNGEFLILMPATDEAGGLIVGKRLANLFQAEYQMHDQAPFKITAFIGLTSLTGGASIPDTTMLQQVVTAMQNARTSQSPTAVSFSKIK